MNKKWLILSAVIFLGLTFAPVIPQIKPYEALTQDGGYYGQEYGVESVMSMIDDWDCNLNCFPQTDQTGFFNLMAFGVATLFLVGLSVGLGWGLKKLAQRFKR